MHIEAIDFLVFCAWPAFWAYLGYCKGYTDGIFAARAATQQRKGLNP
jgi:hypothetical protein